MATIPIESGSTGDRASAIERHSSPGTGLDGRLEQLQNNGEKWAVERDQAQAKQASLQRIAEEKLVRQEVLLKRKKEAESESVLASLCAWIVEHQVGIALDLIAFLALTHILFPRARPWTTKFVQLSYRDEPSGRYRRGIDDAYFVLFCIVAFTGVRVAIMDYVLQPLAKLGGIRSSRKRVRFAEQGWLVLYNSISCSIGFYIWQGESYWLNFKNLWADYPVLYITGLTKAYYLIQFGFWLQQILVVNIEERRKDYAQMFTHHIFTSALLLMSYGGYYTRVGNVILSIMDVVDPLLSLAKCLRYLNFQTACDVTFVVFLLAWFGFRHVVYNMVCWSIMVDTKPAQIFGCYDVVTGQRNSFDWSGHPNGDKILSNVLNGWTTSGGEICVNTNIQFAFIALLVGLQIILLIWFGMIVRVAWRVITGNGADDSRSDDEASDEEAEEQEKGRRTHQRAIQAGNVSRVAGSASVRTKLASAGSSKPIEREVTADELFLPRRASSPRIMMGRKKNGGGRTTAISIPGHSDPKDILNRIGCETKTTDQD